MTRAEDQREPTGVDAAVQAALAHPRGRAAAALRRLGHALMAHEADERLLLEVAEAAERVAALVEDGAPRVRDLADTKRRMFDQPVGDGERFVHFDECFVSGPFNPLGIAMEVRRDGEGVVAEVTLGAAFEGGPGRAHGGIVAAIFDDVLGYLLSVEHAPGFTGELQVRYLAPTPIGVPVRVRAQVVARDGRKLSTSAEATVAGEPVARAQALFIQVDPARFLG
ncbi:MAG: PaaI family thioesterase [Nitriliruptoraceae bacterium]|nr:PaaI family thioesterase [Nitriliruptoraceae bacterium]